MIQPVLDQLNDSFLDKVGNALGAVGEFLAAIGEWLVDVLEQVLQWLSDLVIVVLALALVVFAFVLLSIPAALGLMTWDQVLDAGIGATMILLKGSPPPRACPVVRGRQRDARDEVHRVQCRVVHGRPVLQRPHGGSRRGLRRRSRQDGRPDRPCRHRTRRAADLARDPAQHAGLGARERHGAANDLGSNLALMLAPRRRPRTSGWCSRPWRTPASGPTTTS
ncbi:hypothetical protein NKG05_14870 [Oerskovia sp. M15]